MNPDIALLTHLYAHFNARNIDALLAALAENVAWANGMDGGHLHGREAVRDYWTRQWAIVSPRIESLRFTQKPDGAILVEVQQSIRDAQGRRLEGQTHRLTDKTLIHIFRLHAGQVTRFEILDAF
jgi:hypothetical protein